MSRMFTLVVALLALAATVTVAQSQADAPFRNADLSPEQRAADLVSRMTLEEKVLQMQSTAPAIPRLSVPAYNWWNEALHGVMQGRATVFPQAIGLAATWDVDLMKQVADAISTEARAKYHDAQRRPAPSGPDASRPCPVAPPASPTGRRTSTSSETRAGDADRRPTAKTPISRLAWAWPS